MSTITPAPYVGTAPAPSVEGRPARRPLRPERAYAGVVITAEELCALALAADPDIEVPDDAVPAT